MEVIRVMCLHLLLVTASLPFQVSSRAEERLTLQRSNDPTSVWPAQPQSYLESNSGFKNRNPDLLRFASQDEYENEGNHKVNLQYFAQSQSKKRTFQSLEADVKLENKIFSHRSDDATSLWPAQLQMNEDNDERPTKKQKLEDMEADLKTENKIYEPLPSDKSCPVDTQKCEIPHSEKVDEVCVINKKGSTPEIYSNSVYSPRQINTNNLEVHTLPVGQGDCTVIYCPGGKKAVLFDCGSIGGGDNRFSEEHVRSYFAEVSEITIIVSHGDKDHYSYLPTVFDPMEQRETFNKITKVIIGGPEADLSAFQKIVDWRRELGSKINQTGSGSSSRSVADLNGMNDFCGSSDITFEFIAAGSAGKKNERSIVMKLSRKGGPSSLLFSGDMEDGVAEALATDPATKARLRSTHYKIAHHGASSLANKPNWLKAINPEEAHVSQAYYGRYGHPRCDAIDRLFNHAEIGTTTNIVGFTHPFTCFSGKPKKKGDSRVYEKGQVRRREICHRLYSTAPTEDTICTIVLIFKPGEPATTRYSCGKVDGSKIKDIIYANGGPDDDDDDATGGD